ncbi:unnamed protein product, partial [Ectocarpus sp. 8 AP-2014]
MVSSVDSTRGMALQRLCARRMGLLDSDQEQENGSVARTGLFGVQHTHEQQMAPQRSLVSANPKLTTSFHRELRSALYSAIRLSGAGMPGNFEARRRRSKSRRSRRWRPPWPAARAAR